MENVLLVIGLLSCIALIASVLLQRSEGGALGMGGGGGGGGGLVSSRGAADTLVRATMVLAAIFFCSSLALTRINADKSRDSSEIIKQLEEGQESGLTEAVSPNTIPDISTIDSPETMVSPNATETGVDTVSDVIDTPANGEASADAVVEEIDSMESNAELPADK